MESKETSVPQSDAILSSGGPSGNSTLQLSFFCDEPTSKNAKKNHSGGKGMSSPSDHSPIHPFEEYDDFHDHPPIPIFNYIIDSKTGKLLEDRTGQP